ncbi:hypothetical protein CsSME_00016841 [Camellia sinensis var. sinensis]
MLLLLLMPQLLPHLTYMLVVREHDPLGRDVELFRRHPSHPPLHPASYLPCAVPLLHFSRRQRLHLRRLSSTSRPATAASATNHNLCLYQIGTCLFPSCFPVTASPTTTPPLAAATAADLCTDPPPRCSPRRPYLY